MPYVCTYVVCILIFWTTVLEEKTARVFKYFSKGFLYIAFADTDAPVLPQPRSVAKSSLVMVLSPLLIES
jgi:hypothetical protein